MYTHESDIYTYQNDWWLLKCVSVYLWVFDTTLSNFGYQFLTVISLKYPISQKVSKSNGATRDILQTVSRYFGINLLLLMKLITQWQDN